MSQRQFDDLTRSVAVTKSRRQVLKTIAGAVLAAATMALLGGTCAEASACSGQPCNGPHDSCAHAPGCICCPAPLGNICIQAVLCP